MPITIDFVSSKTDEETYSNFHPTCECGYDCQMLLNGVDWVRLSDVYRTEGKSKYLIISLDCPYQTRHDVDMVFGSLMLVKPVYRLDEKDET